MAIPCGQYCYYDGMLCFMALLHLSGNFRIYDLEGTGGMRTDRLAGANRLAHGL